LHELRSVVYIKNAVESHDLDETVRAVKQWFDDPKNNRWLIICDNYDNPVLGGNGENKSNEAVTDTDAISEGYDIRIFLPDAYQGTVIITTRSAGIQFGHRIPLKKFKNIENSLEILSHTSSRQSLHNGK
jgi:hypothetical protein